MVLKIRRDSGKAEVEGKVERSHQAPVPCLLRELRSGGGSSNLCLV